MPGQPIVLESFGGLVCSARPEDLPENASPRTYDTDFIIGRVIQRQGLQNQYSYPSSFFGPNGGTVVADVATEGMPWTNPYNITLNDGSLTVADTGGAFSYSIERVQAIKVQSGTVFEYYLLVSFGTSAADSQERPSNAYGTNWTSPSNAVGTSGYAVASTTSGSNESVASVTVGFGGFYTSSSAPTVQFLGGGGSGATAAANMAYGASGPPGGPYWYVASVTVTGGGSYTSTPSVVFTGGSVYSSANASATASMTSGGGTATPGPLSTSAVRFTIPSNAVISGIEVTGNAYQNGSATSATFQLLKNGSLAGLTRLLTPASSSAPFTVGSTIDNWGLTIVPTDTLAAQVIYNGTGTLHLNDIQIAVYYSLPLTVPAYGSPYSFSGLTNYTVLNGKQLTSIRPSGFSLASNQAAFTALSQATFGPTADTGTATVDVDTPTDTLYVSNFNFSLPTAESIIGIEVDVTGYSANATLEVQLLKNGSPVGGVITSALPPTIGTVAFGGAANTWGESWGYGDVNGGRFGIVLTAVSPLADTAVYLSYASIKVYTATNATNYNGLVSANLNQSDQSTLVLDSNGIVWQEDVTNNPNVLSIQSLMPAVPAGSYMKGVYSDGTAFLAFNNLVTGSSQPMQFNGQWCDRITQVGPGGPPTFTASQQAGSQCTISAYSASGGVVTLTTSTQAYVAGEVITFSGFTGGCAALNGLTFSILGTGLTTTQIEIASTAVTGSGSDSGVATPQYTFPIAAITQPAAASDPNDPGHFQSLLWSQGPGSKSPGNVITVYYSNSFQHSQPDQTLVNAFNAGYPVYVYVSGAPFGNGTWQVTSIGNAIPPGGSYYRWYFTYQVLTDNYQSYGGPDDAAGTYQITQATLTTGTAVPSLAVGDQISISGAGVASWDGTYNIVASLNSGSFSISQTALANGVATYTWSLTNGQAPQAGQLVTVTGTLNAGGTLNVTNAVIASASGSSSGTFTVNGFTAGQNFPTTVEAGQATTAGTQFMIDPGAALVSSTSQSPIFGNSTGGLLTIVGSATGGTLPIGAGTRQGVVFFVTRDGAVTRPSLPFTFTVANGANYITANQIPLGPPNVVGRGIAFTEAGQNGIPGANFYTYSVPVQFTVNGVTYTASSLYIPDNTTTSAKFTFSDGVLLSSDEIDIQGNNYFNLIEIGNPAWMYQYAGRMFYGLCQTKIQNFLNLSFDGGYLPAVGGALSMPLGWNSQFIGVGGSVGTVTSFSITSNLVTFEVTNTLVAGASIVATGLSTGTYLNGVTLVVASANSTSFTAAFNHADVTSTTDSGTVSLVSSTYGLVASPVFGNSLQISNYSTTAITNTTVLYQSAYQDAYNVPILNANTPYSVRLTGRSLGANGQTVSVGLQTFGNGAWGSSFGTATFTLNNGIMTSTVQPLTGSSGISTIPSNLQINFGVVSVGGGQTVEIDRIEVFPTNNPVDTTTIWVSYVGNFNAVDGVTGQLGCGVDNSQPCMGAYQISESLYIDKTGSICVTQDAPNREPSEWKISLASDNGGSIGINAFDEGEEFKISLNRSGLYLFTGGRPEPISRELQGSGVNASLWDFINWEAANSIWVRNDLINRKLYVGLPLKTPNFYLPNAPIAIAVPHILSINAAGPSGSGRTPGTITVTFENPLPALATGQTYTFAGLTSYTSLNGVALSPVQVYGNTATFLGYSPAFSGSDTGTAAISGTNTVTQPNVILMLNYTGCPTAQELAGSPAMHTTIFGDLKALDMRRKYSLWQIASPIGEFIVRPDSTPQFMLGCGDYSGTINQLVSGAASGGQNTDNGKPINWNYTTYGFVKAKQAQMTQGLGAFRLVWYYMAVGMEGSGQVSAKLYSNTLGALPQNTYTVPLPFTLSYPAQNYQERVLEIGGQKVFVEFTPYGTGSNYAEIGPLILDGEVDRWAPHRGVAI